VAYFFTLTLFDAPLGKPVRMDLTAQKLEARGYSVVKMVWFLHVHVLQPLLTDPSVWSTEWAMGERATA